MELKQIACTELHEHPDHDGIFRDDVTKAIAAEVNSEFPKHHALIVRPESDLVKQMEATGLFYARFIDNWVVLAPTRWKLRKAVPVVNETLAELKVQQHPDKTFIGRSEQGFAFLGTQSNVQTWDFQDQGRTTDAIDQVVQLYELAIGVDRQLSQKISVSCSARGWPTRRWM